MAETNDILNINKLDVEDPTAVGASYDALADACRFETGNILEEMRAEGIIDENGVRVSKNVPADMLNPLSTVHTQ